jgi:hypothetical protein
VHFLDWTLKQHDALGGLGLFSNILYQDINNGCGLRYTDPMEWQEHFNTKHKKTARVLNGLLLDTVEAYNNRFNAEK